MAIMIADVYIQKLEALKHYMGLWVDHYPINDHMSFEGYCNKYYPQMVEGTPEYFRRIATNCYYCNKEMKAGEATIDHFIPKAKGGGDDLQYNRYVICCKVCNGAKAAVHPLKFQRQLRQAITFGYKVGAIEKKRLQRVYENLSQIITEMQLGIKTPIYHRVLWTKKKPQLFFNKKAA